MFRRFFSTFSGDGIKVTTEDDGWKPSFVGMGRCTCTSAVIFAGQWAARIATNRSPLSR